jgi:hypothetical protein
MVQAAGATSLQAIADGLNGRGIPAARGGAWSATQVLRVLAHLKVVPPSPMPLSGSGTWVEFAPSRRACESCFSKNFFQKNSSVGDGEDVLKLERKSRCVLVRRAALR